MPQLIITAKAADGLERCRLFLAEKIRQHQCEHQKLFKKVLTY